MDIEKAITAPSMAFASPDELAQSGELTPEQKLRALKQWDYDVRELQVATEENMDPIDDGGASAELLARIETLLTELGDGNDHETVPTRQG